MRLTIRRATYIICLLALCVNSWACVSYYGCLSGAKGGVVGIGAWADPSVLPPAERGKWFAPKICWAVTKLPNSMWRYQYAVSVYKFGISHVSLETSPSFTEADLSNLRGRFSNVEVGWLPLNPGSPNIPDSMYGIKFDNACGGTSIYIRFDSPREPVWGDIYIKGGQTEIWNAGFVNPDTDPLVPARNCSVGYHVLVPDTNGGVVPEPGGITVLGIGLPSLLACLRRRIQNK